MGKNNASSLKIPSASWIRNVIKEEVRAQLEERDTEKRGSRSDSMDRPQRGGFMDGPMSEFMDGPIGERDGWWDGVQRSERPEARKRERSNDESRSERNERPARNFWDGDWMSEPIMEERPRRARGQDWESSVEREIEASISPVEEKPRSRRTRQSARAKRR